ncbi:MAG TPA: hypothetical protein DDY92_05585 [Dialister sp.]|nr:hypothetical protein [Dialister sp.]
MIRNCKKGLISMLGVGILLASSAYGTPVFAESQNVTGVSVNVQVSQSNESGVNWTSANGADIVAVGTGLPPENAGVRGRVLARRAALVDAYRNLAEMLNGVQLDADTVMEDLAIKSDIVRTKTSALIKGAQIVEEKEMSDGSYQMKIRIPMYGASNSVASVAMPELHPNVTAAPLPAVDSTALPKTEVTQLKESNYTGIVVDASNLGLEPTFAPVIYDENGRVVYGLQNLDYDFAINHGMVAYASSLADAKSPTNRGGSNPLVVKAIAVRGGKNSVNKVNVVVSVEDGDRILLASQGGNILQKAAVVFIR